MLEVTNEKQNQNFIHENNKGDGKNIPGVISTSAAVN